MKRSPFKRSGKPMKRSPIKNEGRYSVLVEVTKVISKESITKPKRKRKKLPSIKTITRNFDAAFSIAVRALWESCPFCGGPIEVCFHFVTRGKHITRWDPINVVGSCANCNDIEVGHPTPFAAWYSRYYGQAQQDELVRRSNIVANFGITERRELYAAFIEGGLDGVAKQLKEIRGRREIESWQ